MKKLLIILFTGTLIAGCSNGEISKEPETEGERGIEATDADKQDEVKQNTADDSKESSDSSGLKIEAKDQPDLGIGDTAKVDTIEGTFELTLESVEIIEDELDGEESTLDSLILLDITLKNTTDETLQAENLLGNFEVTDSLDGTGNPDSAEYFDSVDKMEGPVESDEELSGQFITDIYDKDEYYFRIRSGYAGSGKSNNVVFTINVDEAK